jgi:hypothetical protein
MASTKMDLTSADDLFKQLFVGGSDIQFNYENVLWMKIKKSYGDFLGKQINRGTQLANGGGIAFGSTMPTVNHDSSNYDQANLTSKYIYSLIEIERRAMKQGSSSVGLFDASAMQHEVERAVARANRLMSTALYGDGTGCLYTGNANNANVSGAGTACSPYVIGVEADGNADGFVVANFEEGDRVNINSETTALVVVAIVETAGAEAIKLVGTSARLCTLSGSGAFGASDKIYFENSKDNAPSGLGILENTSGSSYGISHTNRRWQGNLIAAGGQGISEELLNRLVLDTRKRSGQDIDLIVTSYLQYKKIKDFMSDHKRIQIDPEDQKLKGVISFSALLFDSDAGPVPIIADRFCPDDKVYALNTSKIEFITAPGWGWFDDDNTIFLRRDSSDTYQARYGGYGEIYIQPHFHGVITGLSEAV